MSLHSSYDLEREIRFFELTLESLQKQPATPEIQAEIVATEKILEDLERELMYAQDADRYFGY